MILVVLLQCNLLLMSGVLDMSSCAILKRTTVDRIRKTNSLIFKLCFKQQVPILTLIEQIILGVHENGSSNHDVPQRPYTTVVKKEEYKKGGEG